jgi:hypothetical protein
VARGRHISRCTLNSTATQCRRTADAPHLSRHTPGEATQLRQMGPVGFVIYEPRVALAPAALDRDAVALASPAFGRQPCTHCC